MNDKLEIKIVASLDEALRKLDKLNSKLGNTGTSLDKVFNVAKFYAVWKVAGKIRDTVWGWTKNAIDFVETTNKFQMSMGKMTDQATKFQNKMSEAFGTSRKEMMEFQANFNNILSALPGLGEEQSYKLSETLTQMGLDYSSLFNTSTESAMEKIQAAIVGNVKSIRSTSGYDITEASIADLAKELGMEKSIRNMNQMEKRMLRIISLMNQMKATGAMSDMARTIRKYLVAIIRNYYRKLRERNQKRCKNII